MEKEAQSYLQVYTEIEKPSRTAREHQIAVVHRFEGDPIDTTDRNNILRGITKPILYVDPSIDITPDITKMLNASAVADQSGRASPAGQQRRTQ